MPISKYLVIRKAAEIEEVRSRLTMISDINAAFSGSDEYIKKLLFLFNQIKGLDKEENINPKDKDWENRLAKYKR